MTLTALLDVRVEIAADRENDLNEWYARHVPHLMRTPGYASGRRYLALDGGPRYAALYEIEDESFLPSLLGNDQSARHELTLIDLDAWDSELVPHMTRSDFNVWETAGSHHAPVLMGNHPIVQARFDVDPREREAVSRYCDEELLPELSSQPDVVAAARFEPCRHAAVAWIGTRPSAFALLQVSGRSVARELTGGASPLHLLSERAGVSELELSAYRQLLYHAPFGATS